MRRPFLRAHRPLPPRRPDPRARAAGLAAVERALFPRPLAEDVGRALRGRTAFPRYLVSTEAVGA